MMAFLRAIPFVKLNEPPSVAFRCEESRGIRTDEVITRDLAAFLSERGLSCRIMRTPSRRWIIRARDTDRAFTVGLKKGRLSPNERTMVVIADASQVLYSSQKARPDRDVAGLRELCRLIHSFLLTASGISELRWYFEEPGVQSEAVFTPDELEWGRPNAMGD